MFHIRIYPTVAEVSHFVLKQVFLVNGIVKWRRIWTFKSNGATMFRCVLAVRFPCSRLVGQHGLRMKQTPLGQFIQEDVSVFSAAHCFPMGLRAVQN